jgi:antitoxin (DNA-binding transcriptional repressor) of toxin-antitoxin stability system
MVVITERNRIVAEMVPDILYPGAARRSTGHEVFERARTLKTK